VPDQPKILEDDADAPAKSGESLARRFTQLFIKQPDPAAGRTLREVQQLQ